MLWELTSTILTIKSIDAPITWTKQSNYKTYEIYVNKLAYTGTVYLKFR